MLRKIVFSIAIVLLGCLTGCHHFHHPAAPPIVSQVPIPTGYHLSAQYKMQALYHWSLLAEDIANLLKARFETEKIALSEPVYIASFGTAPFEKAFRELLITRMVEKGLAVSDRPCPLLLDAGIQIVTHAREIIRTPMGVYKSLAPGLYVKRDIPLAGWEGRTRAVEKVVRSAEINTEAGRYTVALPKNEIMITTSLTSDGRYVLRNSAIYYIEDSDWSHYVRKTPRALSGPAVVNYSLVDGKEE